MRPTNPYLAPPNSLESAQSWMQGFAFGFQGPPESEASADNVTTDDRDAFNQGMLDGQQAAIEGLEFLDNACVDLNREGPDTFEFLASPSFDALHIAIEAFRVGLKVAVKGGIASAVFTLVELSVSLQTHWDAPSDKLQNYATALQTALGNMGITDSMELFLGGAVDFEAERCELQLTPLFRSADAAQAAADAVGRPGTIVVSWRTDQSLGMKVVQSNL